MSIHQIRPTRKSAEPDRALVDTADVTTGLKRTTRSAQKRV